MTLLSGFFGEQKKSSSFLACDIGSETVKCLAFSFSNGASVAEIVGVGRAKLMHGSARAGSIIDLDEVEDAVRNAMLQAVGELDEKVTNVVFGVSGDLSFGMTTTIRVTRPTDSVISQQEVNDIFGKVYDASYDQVQNEIAEVTGMSDLEIERITSSVVYTKINGKYVKDPVGQTGQKLELALFTAYCPTYHIKALQTLAKKLRLNIVAIGSQMYALVKSLKYSKGDALDCVVLDVGGEYTQAGVVFGGGILTMRTLPIGGSHATEAISKNLGITYLDAEDKKAQYSFDKLPEEESLRVQGSLHDVMDVWLSGVEELFGDFTGVKTFAPKIYLVGGGVILPDVLNCVKNEPWTKGIPFKSPPEFSKLSLENLPKVMDATGRADVCDLLLPASLSIIYMETKGCL